MSFFVLLNPKTVNLLFTTTFILLFPFLAQRYLSRWPVLKYLGPVGLCYLAGILAGNVGKLPIDGTLAQQLAYAALLIGLPLLLFTTDIKAWLKQAPDSLKGFAAAVFSGMLVAIIAAHVFAGSLEQPATTAAMLTGVYTGGTPNMNAVGLMLHAPEELFALLNASDIFWGGLLFLFLISFAARVYGRFLPIENAEAAQEEDQEEASFHHNLFGRAKPGQLLLALLLALLTAGLSAGLVYVFFSSLEKPAWLFLLLTLLSILASFSERIRRLPGSYQAGEYAILAFCVAIGLSSNLRELQAHGSAVFQFTGAVMTGTVLLHALLCRLLRIDRDTTLITLTAALYGPAFIPQVAAALNNRSIILSGILTGLAGYALGNFVGVMVYQLLDYAR